MAGKIMDHELDDSTEDAVIPQSDQSLADKRREARKRLEERFEAKKLRDRISEIYDEDEYEH